MDGSLRGMTRSISLSRLKLPRLRATSALALANALLQQAEGQPLAPHVKAGLDTVQEDRDGLLAALGLKTGAEPPPGVREADIDEDMAWAMLRDFLKVWGQLPGPLGESSSKTSTAVFGSEGLSFVQLPVEEEKAVGDAKLKIIDEHGHAKVIESLGGQPILEHLRGVHARYGAAIAAAQEAEQIESPRVREPMETLLDSLQTYVTRVAGTVERKLPETRKAAEHLLYPLLSWERSSGTPGPAQPPVNPPPPPAS
jgi:hypothetical protein